jgi:hypothetical protein
MVISGLSTALLVTNADMTSHAVRLAKTHVYIDKTYRCFSYADAEWSDSLSFRGGLSSSP